MSGRVEDRGFPDGVANENECLGCRKDEGRGGLSESPASGGGKESGRYLDGGRWSAKCASGGIYFR